MLTYAPPLTADELRTVMAADLLLVLQQLTEEVEVW